LSALPVIHVFPVVCKVRGWPGPHAAGTRLHQGLSGLQRHSSEALAEGDKPGHDA